MPGHQTLEDALRAHAAQAQERWALDQRANAAYYRTHPKARPPEPEGAP